MPATEEPLDALSSRIAAIADRTLALLRAGAAIAGIIMSGC